MARVFPASGWDLIFKPVWSSLICFRDPFPVKVFAARYGIDPDVMYPHSFRHRFAKNFIEVCPDIALLSDLLGHDSIETTRIYLRRSSREQYRIVNQVVNW